jgi:indolepyruvate decarboxylase
MPYSSQNIGNYLIQRLYDHGVLHVFGVPGDFVLGFYQEIILSNKLKVINIYDEQVIFGFMKICLNLFKKC